MGAESWQNCDTERNGHWLAVSNLQRFMNQKGTVNIDGYMFTTKNGQPIDKHLDFAMPPAAPQKLTRWIQSRHERVFPIFLRPGAQLASSKRQAKFQKMERPKITPRFPGLA
jgi:hypothetical protein